MTKAFFDEALPSAVVCCGFHSPAPDRCTTQLGRWFGMVRHLRQDPQNIERGMLKEKTQVIATKCRQKPPETVQGDRLHILLGRHLGRQDSQLPVAAEVYERTSTGISSLLQVRPEGRNLHAPNVSLLRRPSPMRASSEPRRRLPALWRS